MFKNSESEVEKEVKNSENLLNQKLNIFKECGEMQAN